MCARPVLNPDLLAAVCATSVVGAAVIVVTVLWACWRNGNIV